MSADVIAKILLQYPHIKVEPFGEDDHVMTAEAFIEAVKCGAFIDDDGCGDLAFEDCKTNLPVYPSQANNLDMRFTHIVWYNK